MSTTAEAPSRQREVLEAAVIRFAGDSGDGMQITGNQFTNTTALFGNDLATFPDYPGGDPGPRRHAARRLRVPGPLRGPRHLHARRRPRRAGRDEPGGAEGEPVGPQDERDPHRQRRQLQGDRPQEGAAHARTRSRTARSRAYRVFPVELTKLTRAALADVGLDAKSMDRCKNFFALGMCYWLFNRPLEATERWLDEKFRAKPVLAEANKLALKAGYAYCDATEAFQVRYEVPPAKLTPGYLPQPLGQHRAGPGLRGRGAEGGADALPGQLPDHAGLRHPARARGVQGVRRHHLPGRGRDRRHQRRHRRLLRRLPRRSPRPPGPAWRSRARPSASRSWSSCRSSSCNVQRGGPSTGLPTKTEQADLFQALFGRNSEAPLPVLAASSPGDCFGWPSRPAASRSST